MNSMSQQPLPLEFRRLGIILNRDEEAFGIFELCSANCSTCVGVGQIMHHLYRASETLPL